LLDVIGINVLPVFLTQCVVQFYESCSVNSAETTELKASRLSLCTATAGSIRLLMSLLGIEVVEKL
jgi:arginyl-tRNA synthetase